MSKGRVVIFGWSESMHIKRWATGLQGRGYAVRVVSLGGLPLPGLDTVNLPRRGRADYFFKAKEAVQRALEFEPDLIHTHYTGGHCFWSRRIENIPQVMSVWGSDVVALPHNPFWRRLIRRTLQRADRVTATSQFLREVCVDTFGLAAADIQVIPFGIEAEALPTPEPPPTPVRLCFIKHLRPVYAPDLLVQAIARVRETGVDARLAMTGEAGMIGELQKLVKELQLGEYVEFLGYIRHSDVLSLLDNSHIMVMPSRRESFGVAVLEASSRSRPVIATDVDGISEVLVDGETGLLVPPDDIAALAEAILKLAGDAALRNRMGQMGRQLVEDRYPWKESLDKMETVYQEVMHAR